MSEEEEEKERPPDYDCWLFLPPMIRYYNYYQHPPMSTTYRVSIQLNIPHFWIHSIEIPHNNHASRK